VDQASVIRRSARLFGHNQAVWCDGQEQTYEELFDRACRLANALRELGAEPGDRVAVLSPNAVELVEQAAACALGNYPRVTLYTYHSAAINHYLLELVGARVLLVHSDYYDDLAPLLEGLPELKGVLVFGTDRPSRSVDYETALSSVSAKDVRVSIRPDDVHIIRFSSGTTGKPKPVFHSVQRWANTTDEWRWITPSITERSRYLAPIALAHLGVALLWDMLSVGGAIVPMPAFDPERALDLVAEHEVTHLAAAPVMIRDMVEAAQRRPRDLSSLQCVMYAGSPIAPDTMRRAISVFGPNLHQLYAQSEALPATMLFPHQHVLDGTEVETRRLRSVGRPTPHTVVTIRGEDGDELPTGEIGEIAVLSDFTMSGLWGDPDGTAQRTLPDGAILTRDMGYVDDDGFVYLVDRKDDMIVSGGYNIWPAELEEVLLTHPRVLETAVFGVPDEKWGETPKAAVVLRRGTTATEAELVEYTRGIVGGVKKVTSVDFLDALPRTTTGKVQRGLLKDPYWAGRDSRIQGT
jgi:acyl-CoA synthetase (AMP-forming)/AMP-acid ligase II